MISPTSRHGGRGEESRGLLRDLRFRGTAEPVSLDDDRRYWLAVNGHVYLWDYTLSDYLNPSWFYWTDINAAAFVRDGSAVYHMDAQGRLSGFNRSFTDYGGPIHRVFRFATQSFGPTSALRRALRNLRVRATQTGIGSITAATCAGHARRAHPRLPHLRLTPRDLSFRTWGLRLRCRSHRVFGASGSGIFNACWKTTPPGADLCLIGAELH
jgi:hypothetical protein